MSATKWEYFDNSGNYTQKEFEPSLKVYVKKSAENAYKTADRLVSLCRTNIL